jgi:hypothetical protein
MGACAYRWFFVFPSHQLSAAPSADQADVEGMFLFTSASKPAFELLQR